MTGSTIDNNTNGIATHANTNSKKRKLRDPFSSVLNLNLSSRDVEHLQSCRPATTTNAGTKTQFAVHPHPPPPTSSRPLTHPTSSVLSGSKPITCCITIHHGTDRIYLSKTAFQFTSNDLPKVLVGVTEQLVVPDPKNSTIPIQTVNFILETAALKSKINPVVSQEPRNNVTADQFEPELQQLSKNKEDPVSDQFGSLEVNSDYPPYALASTNQTINTVSKHETIVPRPPAPETPALVPERLIVKHRSRVASKTSGFLIVDSPFPPATFSIDNVEKLTFYLQTLTIRPGMVFMSHEEVKFMALVYNLLIAKRPYIVQYDNKKRGIFRLGCSQCSFAFRSTNLNVYSDENLSFPYPSLIYVTEFVPHTCAPHPVAEETRLVSTKWHNYLALLFDFFGGPWKVPSLEKREIVLRVIEQLYMVIESNTVIRPLKSKLSRLSSLISIYTRGGFELSVHPQALLSKLFLPALLIQTKFPKTFVRLYFDSDSQHGHHGVRIYAPPLKTDGTLNSLKQDHFDHLIERALPRYLSHVGNPNLRPVGALDLDVERFIQDQLLAFGSDSVSSVSNSDDVDEEPPENYWTVDSILQNNSSPAFNMSQSQRNNNSSFITADMMLPSERFFNDVSIDQRSYISYLQTLKAIKTTTERIQFIRMEYTKFDIVSDVSLAVLPELPSISVAVKTGFEPIAFHLECCKIGSVEHCSKHASLESNHKFYTNYVKERTGVNPHVFADLFQQTFPDYKDVNNSKFKGITIITEDMRKAAQYCLPLISIDKISSRTKTYGYYNIISAVGYTVENDLSIFGISIVPETDQYLLDGYLEFFRDLKLTYGTLFNDRNYSFTSCDVTGSQGIEYALETVFPERKRYKSFLHWKQDYLRQVPLKKRDLCNHLLNKLLVFSDDPSSPDYKRVLAELITDYSVIGSLADHDGDQAVYSDIGLCFGHASTDTSEAFHVLICDLLKQSPLMIPSEICKIQQRVMARTVDSTATGCKIRFANDRVALTPKCSEMLVLGALFASQFEVVPTETSIVFWVHLKEDSFLASHQENLLEVPLLYESVHFGTDASTNTLVQPGEIAKLAVQLLLSKKSYVVDFGRRRCSCGYFQRNQMPCPHALAVLLSTSQLGPVSNYCNSVFHCSSSSPAANMADNKAITSVSVTESNMTLAGIMFFNEFIKRVNPGYHVDDDLLEENGASPEYIATLTKTIISQLPA